MENKKKYDILSFLIIAISFTLFFLKIYDYWWYIPLLIIGAFIAYKKVEYVSTKEKKKLILTKIFGILAIAILYWIFLIK